MTVPSLCLSQLQIRHHGTTRLPRQRKLSALRKDRTFAISNLNTKDPIEARISDVLWQWRFAALAVRDRIVVDSDLASLLEFWFPFEDITLTRRLGTWCDGIPLLRLRDINRTAFLMAGVGYFPHDFSPFELEYHYNNRRDRLTSRIVLRFGISDHDSGLTTFACSTSPEQVLAQSPRHVRDWAVAVELTPQCT